MATHSRILAYSIPRTEEPGGLQSMGRKKSDTTEATWHAHMHTATYVHGYGIMQGSFTSLKSSELYLFILPYPLTPGNHWSSSCLPSFAFSRTLYSWNRIIYSLFILSSFFSPGGSDSKETACNAGDSDLIPGWGRSPGEGNGNPLQDSWLGNSMDRGVWRAIVHGVTRARHDWETNTFT